MHNPNGTLFQTDGKLETKKNSAGPEAPALASPRPSKRLDSNQVGKAASDFAPDQSVVWVGFTLVIKGENLSSSDLVMVSNNSLRSNNSCSDAPLPQEIRGGSQRYLGQVSSDGKNATATFTLQEQSAEFAQVCIKLYPSSSWSLVSTKSFKIIGPNVSSVSLASYPAAADPTVVYGYSLLTLSLKGIGMIMQSTRLAFKLQVGDCAENPFSSASNIFGGDARGLSWASSDAGSGLVSFLPQNAIKSQGSLTLCMSSNEGAFKNVLVFSSIRWFSRQTTNFFPVQDILPALSTTITISGENFDTSGAIPLYIKLSDSCNTSGDSSLIPGGDAKPAQVLSSTSATFTFAAGPLLGHISSISIVEAGQGYVPGKLFAAASSSRAVIGSFLVGRAGDLAYTFFREDAAFFAEEPDIFPIFAGSVRCGNVTSDLCNMTGSIPSIALGYGITQGCAQGAVISAVSSDGGYGFQAVISSVDNNGRILATTVTNYGANYKSTPQLIVEQLSCYCGTYIITDANGNYIVQGLQQGSVPGSMDNCMTANVAGGAVLASRGQWSESSIRVCSRFGNGSEWEQVGDQTMTLKSVTAVSLNPLKVTAGLSHSITLTGTGFMSSGPWQTRVKAATDCSANSESDLLGSVLGGEGVPCAQIVQIGALMECVVNFKLRTSSKNVSICTRVGGNSYQRFTSALLEIVSFQIQSVTPSLFPSNSLQTLTVSGQNFFPVAADNFFIKICSHFHCSGGQNSNAGEPCAGLQDTRTCFNGASCTINDACDSLTDTATTSQVLGGNQTLPSLVKSCTSQGGFCNELVFDVTVAAMVNASLRLWWIFSSSDYGRIDGTFIMGPTEVADVQLSSATPLSSQTFFVDVTGSNLADSQLAPIKFKFINDTSCTVADPFSDTLYIFPGGEGRTTMDVQVLNNVYQARVNFTLFATAYTQDTVNSILCWRQGPYAYRDIWNSQGKTFQASIATSVVEGMTPSDYMTANFVVGKTTKPLFASNQAIMLTVKGQNLFSSALFVKPIRLPQGFQTSATCATAANCIPSSLCASSDSLDFFPTSVEPPQSGTALLVYEVKETVFDGPIDLMFCWNFMASGSYGLPWRVIGTYQEIFNSLTFQFDYSFRVHILSINGAYLSQLIVPPTIISNVPFNLTLHVNGIPCELGGESMKVKVVARDGYQSNFSGAIGGGCSLNSLDDWTGVVTGGQGMVPKCVSTADGRTSLSMFEMDMNLIVDGYTSVEICWSPAQGNTSYMNVFYQDFKGYALLDILPFQLNKVELDLASSSSTPAVVVHDMVTFRLYGRGLKRTGVGSSLFALAESCDNMTSIIPGGESKPLDCILNSSQALVTFRPKTSSANVYLCYKAPQSVFQWVQVLAGTGLYCAPPHCAATSCAAGTNYNFQQYLCDASCCEQTCMNDKSCTYYQTFLQLTGVYLNCSTSSQCNKVLTSVRPPVVNKKQFLTQSTWVTSHVSVPISAPDVRSVTPQTLPKLRARSSFVVNLQGSGFAPENLQVHIKVSSFATGCNNLTLYNETLAKFDLLLNQRATAYAEIEHRLNMTYNGTCAKGIANCLGGPAPPGTPCTSDANCPNGICDQPNNGMTCLLDSQCKYAGFCNNSLYNLSISPLPVPPPFSIPNRAYDSFGTLPGGGGRFVNVTNFSFAFSIFNINSTGRGLICVASRDPIREEQYVKNGVIVDRRLIVSMFTYKAYYSIDVQGPVIYNVFPSQTFRFVTTRFSLGGYGLHETDKIKIVSRAAGCGGNDTDGAVLGGEGRFLSFVNPLRTGATLVFTITEPWSSQVADNEYLLCYLAVLPQEIVSYRQVGHLILYNSPPLIVGLSSSPLFYYQTSVLTVSGLGLGAAEKVKLISEHLTCSGSNSDEANYDLYGVINGSWPTFLSFREYSFDALTANNFSNFAYVGKALAHFLITSVSANSSRCKVCLKFSSSNVYGYPAGYSYVGDAQVELPRVESVWQEPIVMEEPQQVAIRGRGLLTQLPLRCLLIQTTYRCSQPDLIGRAVAGGDSCTLDKLVSSESAYLGVFIPRIQEQQVKLCIQLATEEWREVGVLPLIGVDIINVSLMTYGSGTGLDSLAVSQPFYLKFTFVGRFFNDYVKLVPGNVTCAGTDDFADALAGGEGKVVNESGVVEYPNGIQRTQQVTAATVKTCMSKYMSQGYQDSTYVWNLTQRRVDYFLPQQVRKDLYSTLNFYGKGLAYSNEVIQIYVCTSSECSQPIVTAPLKLDLLENGEMGSIELNFSTAGEFEVYWSMGGQEKHQLANLTVVPTSFITSLFPTGAWVGNTTKFVVGGVGLTSSSQVRFVEVQSSCKDAPSIAGGNASVLNVSNSQQATSVPYHLKQVGTVKLCYAQDASSFFEETRMTVELRQWTEPLLFLPQADYKKDVQRVEAGMTDELPPCILTYQSRWILHGPGNGIEVETPAILDWNSSSRCYSSPSVVPAAYPKRGYVAPGIDMRLVNAYRNVPVDLLVIADSGAVDVIYIARSACHGDSLDPLVDPVTAHVRGGEPQRLNESDMVDVTESFCLGEGPGLPLSPPVLAYKVRFTLQDESPVGEFHKICLAAYRFGVSFAIQSLDLKVRPPHLLAMEPPTIFSGLKVKYLLHGKGLAAGDQVKVIDGDTPGSCANADQQPNIPGGQVFTLNASATDLYTSEIEMQLLLPFRHARMCYQYQGSEVWDEMTYPLNLRTSGYIYGYFDSMHFLYGETLYPQQASNQLFSRNQTISVISPEDVYVNQQDWYCRTPLTITVHGNGLSDKGKYVIVPSRYACGGTSVNLNNIIAEASSAEPQVHLIPVSEGDPRGPTSYSNDPLLSYQYLSYCQGTRQVDACTRDQLSTQNTVSFSGFPVSAIGQVRVCFKYDFASEYIDIGNFSIKAPIISSLSPSQRLLLNSPQEFTVLGVSLSSDDFVKFVDGESCVARIASYPYTPQLRAATDGKSASFSLLLVGAGTYTSGTRKLCYSYDSGTSFLDTGLTVTVVSPQVVGAFPLTTAVAADRRIWFYGDAITSLDKVKLIHYDSTCKGSDDMSDIVLGGEARLLVTARSSLYESWPNGSAVFKLLRVGSARICYLHKGGAGWTEVLSPEGTAIRVTTIDTAEEALGILSSAASCCETRLLLLYAHISACNVNNVHYGADKNCE
ncbi:hypothetical protein GUITHDRAFT_108454 [Guillardia theta CCMP2712]|uniref:Uncharacterized protein n=4 Tax=Guillardia theta TaxID=55529 RepID=L1JAM4_GUITC|nr:hypothetical protein GUITHDRAFT_108454 [Guillardia theta CCMP2712]EKX45581.1 hypothetical protein GUITHDRAFT_108454 [Guillardia theta CCMP2712]|eukprot:XP_005832561.1 hypothetical protein GUITHDRAFT_108454 [Guillardia theta CCMP2712]